MRVLLTESSHGAADESERHLRGAGYDISFCRPDHGASDSCVVLRDAGHCPLRTDDISLVIDVRADDAPSLPSAREFGSYCGLRRGVPVVVAGPADRDSFPWSQASAICRVDELIGTCGTVAERIDTVIHQAAEHVVRQVLLEYGCDVPVEVSVVDAAGDTAVFIRILGPSDPDARARAVGMIHQTLRGRKGFNENVTVVVLPTGSAAG